MVELTEKQRRFADEYIISANAESAATLAGYKSPRGNAHKLLQNTAIKAYIDERLDELKSSKIADQAEIMEFLTSVVRGERTEEVLRGTGKGAQTIDEINIGASDRIKAAELIGKRFAMWTDKQQIEGVQQVVIHNDLQD